MRFAMIVRGSRRVGRVDKTEAGTALGVVPVREVFHPVPILNLEVLPMRWQNPYAERLNGTKRCDFMDQFLVYGSF